MPKGKIHGQGGHGRFSRELQRKYEHEQTVKKKQERSVEKSRRKFTAGAEKEVAKIVAKGEAEIIPIANCAKAKLESVARRGGMNKEGFILRILGIDKFVVDNIRKLFEKNPVVKEYLSEIDWENYHWISSSERTELLLQIVGKNPKVKKQRRILNEIDSFSKKTQDMANGRI